MELGCFKKRPGPQFISNVSIGNHTVSSSIWNYFCTSEFFKKLKLLELLRHVQFQLFEKLTSAN